MPDPTSPQGGSISSPQHNPSFLDEQRNFRILLVYRAVLALAVVVTAVAVCLIILVCRISHHRRGQELRANKVETAKAEVLPDGSWRFIVSGDSRNCGDVIMPAIAAHSARFAPSFYWHLGDLRAIYKIDEDMAFAASNNGQELACSDYLKRAWGDFVEHQIMPFGHLPFYVGIGNHEVMLHRTEDEFRRQFAEWLDQATLRQQRLKDKEPAQPETYYHWIQEKVDFIYLDNADNSFSPDEAAWLKRRLADDKTDSAVKSVVVGMHEALPDSLANSHSMGDRGEGSPGTKTGREAYKDLKDFRDQSNKPVYVLASHSHFYMENIFNSPSLTAKQTRPLPGWIVGTAGAERYALPEQPPPSGAATPAPPIDPRPNAITDVYGYLLGTVASDGSIQFSFQAVHETDIPQPVRDRYNNAIIPWCFAHNSQNRDPKPKDITARCIAPQTGTAAHDSH
jgi:hypothetical protein